MDKLKMHTPNKADENYEKLAALFPNAVTETIDPVTGEVVRAIDKDVLMQEINTTVVDGEEERYQFTWPDKKKSILLANSPISKTLRPCREESVDFDNTENLYIEGTTFSGSAITAGTLYKDITGIGLSLTASSGKTAVISSGTTVKFYGRK